MGFVFFMVFFCLEKHKKGKPAEKENMFCSFHFDDFFVFVVFGIFQDARSKMRMQEMRMHVFLVF